MIEQAPDLFLEEDRVRFYGFAIQTRMTVLRLRNADLFLHSPTFLRPATRAALDALGAVHWIVSPNKIHNLALAQYAEAFPACRLYAPPGLPERRPELRFEAVLGDAAPAAWAGQIDQVAVRGNAFFSEILFFHRASRTLIVGDLVEILDDRTASRAGRALASLFGVGREPVASPEHRYYTVDPDAAQASLERARQWPFERIVPAHGAVVERDAAAVFARVCDEFLASVRRRGAPARWLFSRMARLQ